MLKTQNFLTRRLTLTVGAGFALSLVLMAALTFIGLRELASTDARMKRIVQENSVKSRLANQMRDILRGRSASMLSIVVMSDPFDRDEEMQHFYALGSRYQKARFELDPMLTHPKERAIIKQIDNLTRQNQPLMVRTIDLGMDGYTFLAFEVLQNEGLPMQRALIEQIDKLIDLQRDATQQASGEAAKAYEQTRWLMLVLGIAAASIAALVALLVLRRTSRLAAETERERTKFQTLFETNTDGIVILDKNCFTECNPATLEMFGIDSTEKLLGMRPEDMGSVIQPDGSLAVQLASKHIREAMETGHATFYWEGRRSDGSTFPAEIALHAMALDGRTSLQAIIHDTTQQKEAEATLKAAHAAAVAAAEIKSQFVANVSHEIRTPMNGIIGMTHLLQGSRLNERQREYADAIAHSAEALLHIINDLLDFSKIEAGRLSIEEIVFDLPALLADAIELYKPRAAAKGLELRLEKSDDTPLWVRGDPFRIRQILLNLLDNAIKFTERGVIRLQFARHPNTRPGDTRTNEWRFCVQDSGIGIPSQALSHIFDAFSQADGSTSRQFGGTGLGLTICQQLAHLMGGNLSVESQDGKGSAFFLDLPLDISTSAPEMPGLPVSETPRFEGARILVAEDNPTNQKLLQFMLEGIGIEVLTANNGKLAYDLICTDTQDRRVDLVLMDCQMPEWDGLTATRAIRQWERDNNSRRLPVLALTANAMSGFAEICAEAGMDDYLTKPLLEEELIAALKQWLDASPRRATPVTQAPLVSATDIQSAELTDLLDLPRLRKLCRNDPRQVVEMLHLFVKSTEESISELTHALETDNAAQCARQAHQIKGATAYLGATEMNTLASQVEITAKSENQQELANQIEDLEAAFIQIRLFIERAFPG